MKRILENVKPFLPRLSVVNAINTVITILVIGLLSRFVIACFLYLLLLFHENGHRLAGERLGYKFNGIIVLPLFGMALAISEQVKSLRKDAIMALAGPVVGLAVGYLFLGLYRLTFYDLFAAFAFISAVVHFVNLVPVFPLDGGRIMRAIVSVFGPKAVIGFAWVSLAICVCLAIYMRAPIWIFIAFISFSSLGEHTSDITKTNLQTSGVLLCVYIGLLFLTLELCDLSIHMFKTTALLKAVIGR